MAEDAPSVAGSLAGDAGELAALDALLHRSSDAVAVATTSADDPILRISRVNAALCELFGHADDELTGHSPDVLVGPETDLDTLRRMQTSLRAEGHAADDVVFHHRDGRAIPVHATYDRVAGTDGAEWYVAVFHDRSADRAAAAALWRSEEWAQAIIRSISDVIVVTDADSRVKWVTPSVTDRLGYDADELRGTLCADLVHPEDQQLAVRLWDQVLRRSTDFHPVELRIACADGGWRVMRVVSSNLTDHPAVEGFVIAASDVTERAAAGDLLSEQAELLEAIARGAPLDVVLQSTALMLERRIPGAQVAIGVTGHDGRIRVRAAPTLPRDLINLFDEAGADPIELALLADLDGWARREPEHGESAAAAALHELGVGAVRMASLRSPGSDELVGALVVLLAESARDAELPAELLERACNLATIAVERQRFESALEHRANYDELTGIPNRSLLLQRVGASLTRASRHGHGVAVLFIDLDRFRVVNDSVGHVLGDRLLHQVTVRLTEGLRPGDTLGRFGGDEFMVVCNRVTSDDDARAVAERILTALNEPFELGDPHGSVVITASIGIAVSHDGGHEPPALVRNADVAMFRAKDQGRNQLAVFDDTLDLKAVEKLTLEQALRTAIDEEQLELHLQPVVRLIGGAITHVEALVRWQRPGHGLVMPAAFIPLAEESGLVVPMGWWVLAEAAAHAMTFPNGTGDPVGIAVNLSARQLTSPELVPTVAAVLEQTGLAPSRLYLEVTESALVHDVEQAKSALEQVKALGVRIAIDDFGTGYATLDYLRQFSMADELKIDQSFIEGVEVDGSREEAIVAAAVGIAESLGVTVVAEGVETEAQAEALRRLGVELAQGYLFSRPLPVHEATQLLHA